jgi:hypothetical protein
MAEIIVNESANHNTRQYLQKQVFCLQRRILRALTLQVLRQHPDSLQ